MEKATFATLMMAIVFFLLFTAFSGGATLMSSIYDQQDFKGLGQINVFTLYIVYTIFNLFAENLVSK